MQLIEQIESGIRVAVEALGFDVWGVELVGGRGFKTLRIYIDGPDGVHVEDCARVSADVGAILDVEDWLQVEYNLEVSSPGLDRFFFHCSQLVPYVGQELSVKLKRPVEGRSRFIGELVRVEEDGVFELLDEGQAHRFAFDDAVKVRLIPDY